MRRYLVFTVAILGQLLHSINNTSVSVAFPSIVSSFGVSLVVASWALSAYQLALTAVLPVSGKISDALGRKVTFLGFLTLFTAGTILCAFAPNIEFLIAFRLIQGLGGSGLVPSVAGIVADEFPESRQRAIGLISSVVPIGWMIGPSVGGWVTTVYGWRSIFWMNLPICAVGLVAGALFMRGGERRKSKVDLVGSVLLAGALAGFMIGLSQIGEGARGETPWGLLVLLIGLGTACLVLFLRRQARVEQPIIEPEVLRGRPFMAANIYNFVFGCILGSLALVPFYAVSIYGASTLTSGLLLIPRSITMIALSSMTSMFLVRWGYRRPLLIGTTMMIPGFVIMAFQPASFNMLGLWLSGTDLLMVIMGFVGLGFGFISPASNNACIELMPNRIATISAVRSMFRQAGQVLVVTVGSLLLHIFGVLLGFEIFLLGLTALVACVMIPSIFMMPRSPQDSLRSGKNISKARESG